MLARNTHKYVKPSLYIYANAREAIHAIHAGTSIIVLMLGVLLCAPAKVGSYAAFVAWQRLLVCVARKYLYTCTDAFALPSTALKHHSSIIYMRTRIYLAQHGTRANAPSFLLFECCGAVFALAAYIYVHCTC